MSFAENRRSPPRDREPQQNALTESGLNAEATSPKDSNNQDFLNVDELALIVPSSALDTRLQSRNTSSIDYENLHLELSKLYIQKVFIPKSRTDKICDQEKITREEFSKKEPREQVNLYFKQKINGKILASQGEKRSFVYAILEKKCNENESLQSFIEKIFYIGKSSTKYRRHADHALEATTLLGYYENSFKYNDYATPKRIKILEI